MKEATTFVVALVLLAMLGACAEDYVSRYAVEHNILGERVCNADLENVGAGDVLERGCPSDADSIIEIGEIPDEIEEIESKAL